MLTIWRKKFLAVGAAALMTVGLAACGDDDGDSGSAAQDSDGETASGELSSEFCDANDRISAGFDQLMGALQGGEGPPAADQVKQAFQEAGIGEALDDLEASAPDDLKGELEAGIAKIREAGETGDPSHFEDPAVETAGDAADKAAFDGCEGNKLEASGIDYAFKDLPMEVKAGKVRVKFTNEGKEVHELVLVKPKAGVTETIDELLQLPQEQAQQKADAVFLGFAAPGESGYNVAEVPAGDYLAVCFIPKGMTSPDQEDVQGRPHVFEGMRQPVKVA